ncbi:MAG TPA: Na-translocating system protein MpsC family protein [Solirubrobacteraceae bacterium]|nr:Na-translocating system protein MpsC family protein [Solirubrobacteraceae bacterium]
MRSQEDIMDSIDYEEHPGGSAVTDRSPMLEISNAMVRLYKEAFGRGPTKARAQFAGQDTLVVILENSLTVAERNLVAMGEHQRLREARLFFQYALEEQFRAIVEQALDRRTVAFISGMDTARDVAMEVFTLEPTSDEEAGADQP